MGYVVLADAPLRRSGSYSIRGIRPGDTEPIRLWRNAQLSVLRQFETLSYHDQLVYFWQVVAPDFGSLEPRQVLLTLSEGGYPVAYGGLTHIDWRARRGELSFLANPIRRACYKDDFAAFLRMVIPLAFEDLGLHRIWHETWASDVHIDALRAAGFEREGILRDHALVNGHWVDSLIYGIVQEGEEA